MGAARQTSPLRRGLATQFHVISALMIREALGRYGHESLGFFWIIGEPLLLTCGIMILWSAMGASHGAEVGVIPFALTGYSFITLWRHIVNRSVRVMTQNAPLRYHRQVMYLDVMLARAALETVAVFAAFLVAYLPLSLLGFCPEIHDPLTLVGGFVLTAWFSLGVGMVLSGLSELNEAVHFFIPPIMYLTIPLTGIFFMVDWLPARAQALVVWSPLVNGIEMFRSGLFPEDVATRWSASYLVICSAVLTCVGVSLCCIAEKNVGN